MKPVICRLQLILIAVCVLVFPLAAIGQTTGTISGTVKDSTGAVIPSATVNLTNPATGAKRTATTNGAGEYSFPSLAPGTYDVEFRSGSFTPVLRHVTLNVTEHVALDTTMQVSTTQQEINVTSDAPILQTQDDALGRVVDGQAIQQLPLATRNFTQILALSPGTSVALNNATALGRGTQNISADGARPGSNAFYIDGVDAVNIHVNSASNNTFASNGVVIPSPDAVQEFKVQTGLYDVTAGRSGGANVALLTRSGTGKFHGSVFEFIRNDDLNANLYFFNQLGTPRPELKQNQFGGTIGGPVLRDRLFFFFSYQGTRQVNGVAGSESLVLPAIPATRTNATLGAAFAGQATYAGGTTVNASGSNISPVALALLNLKFPNGQYVVPSPSSSATTGVNYTVSKPSTFNEDQYVDAIDYNLTARNHISFKSIFATQPQFNAFPSATVPGFGTNQLFQSQLYSLTDTQIITPNLVNEARMGATLNLGATGFQNLVPLSSIGMSRFNSAQFGDIPSIVLAGGFTLGYSVNADQADASTNYQYFDNLSYVHGKHQMAYGAEARLYQDNYYSNNQERGVLTIENFSDLLLGLAGTSVASGGNGSPKSYSNVYTTAVASGQTKRNDELHDYAMFAQDSWRIVPNLTFIYGVRWEYVGLPVDKGGRDGAFYLRNYVAPAPGAYSSAGFVQTRNSRNPIPGIPFVSDTMTDTVGKKNFGPRLGVAFQPAKWINIRAGYALSVDRASNQLGLLEALSLPSYEKVTLSGVGNTTATLANPFPTLPTANQFPIVPQVYGGPIPFGTAYPATNPPLSIYAFDPKFRTPYVQQFGMNVQLLAKGNTVFEIGYVGSHGVALPVETQANQPLIASANSPVNGITTTTAANAQFRVPYIGFSDSSSGLTYLQTRATSVYNSLQTSVTHRLSHGLQMLASYTYAKSMDTESSASDGTTFSGFDGDQTNLAGNWAPSDYNVTNRLVVSGIYSIPAFGFVLDRTAFGRRLFSGWQIAGVGTAQTGLPFTVTDSKGAAFYATAGTNEANFAPGATPQTARLTGSTTSRLTHYFNTAAFVTSGNYYGNSGRNILHGPSQKDIDASLIKDTQIRDSVDFEFRAEFFNVLNIVNFANPGSALQTASTFGVISATNGNPRIIQFAAKIKF
jgi:hypothetical protein